MTNGELIAILQRFPAEGQVFGRLHRVPAEGKQPITQAEMQIDATPLPLARQNIGWSELVKERVQVVLIVGGPETKDVDTSGPTSVVAGKL